MRVSPSTLGALALVPTLVACVDPAVPDTGALLDDELEDALPLEGCSLDVGFFEGVSLEATAIPTVHRVTWSTSEPASSGLVFDNLDGRTPPVATPLDASGSDHEALIAGLPAEAQGVFRLRAVREGATLCSRAFPFDNGGLPPSFPPLEVELGEPSRLGDEYLLTTLFGEAGAFEVVLDRFGRVVWWREGAMLPRAQYSPSEGIFVSVRSGGGGGPKSTSGGSGEDGEPELALVSVEPDGTLLRRLPLPPAENTLDLTLLPEGGAAVLLSQTREYRTADGVRHILGARIVEVAADGAFHHVWSLFDAFEPDLGEEYERDVAVGPDSEDWAHVNAFGYDPAEDAYYVVVSHWDAIARVERVSGETTWLLGGPSSDFQHERDLVAGPHSVQAVGDGRLLVFNRWVGEDDCAEGTELELSIAPPTATAVGHFRTEACRDNPYLGDARRLSNGGTLVMYSSVGLIAEVDPEGQVVREISAPLSWWFGYGQVFAGFYRAE
jgi:hypothetical protein